MATFTRDWNEATVADTAQANTLGAVDRANQVDLSDRLKALIYGFVAGENDGVPGCKNLAFKEQASDPTVGVDTITLYAKDIGGNNELFTKDEAANVVQLTTAGAVGAGGVTLLAGKDLIGSATSDITINTNKFTVAGATGNTVIAGTLTQTGAVAAAASITLGAGADLIGSGTSDITINTNKFTVAGASGNTVIAGTLDVTGVTTGLLKLDGTTIFNTTFTSGSTFQDLDIAALADSGGGITAAPRLVFLEVKSSVNMDYVVKPKGQGGTYAAHENATGFDMGCAQIHFSGANEYGYVTVATDANGVLQHGADTGTATIKLIGYI